jgi:hypothetical protein
MPRASSGSVSTYQGQAVVPPGALPGSQLLIQGPSGSFYITVPVGVGPGQMFNYQLPASPTQPSGVLSTQPQPHPGLPAQHTGAPMTAQTSESPQQESDGAPSLEDIRGFGEKLKSSTYEHPNKLKRYLRVATIISSSIMWVCVIFICVLLLLRRTHECQTGKEDIGVDIDVFGIRINDDVILRFDYDVSKFDDDPHDSDANSGGDYLCHDRPDTGNGCDRDVGQKCCEGPYIQGNGIVGHNHGVCCDRTQKCCAGVCCDLHTKCCNDLSVNEGRCTSIYDECPAPPPGPPSAGGPNCSTSNDLANYGWGASAILGSFVFLFAKLYGLRPDGPNRSYAINLYGLGGITDKMIAYSAPFMLTFVQKVEQQGENTYAFRYTVEQQIFGVGLVGVWYGLLVVYGLKYAGYVGKGYVMCLFYITFGPYILMWRYCCCCFHKCCCDPYAASEDEEDTRTLAERTAAQLKADLLQALFRAVSLVLFVSSLCGTLVYLLGWFEKGLAFLGPSSEAHDNSEDSGVFSKLIAPLLAYNIMAARDGVGVWMCVMSICGTIASLAVNAGMLLEEIPCGYSKKLREKFGVDHYGYNHPDGRCDWADVEPESTATPSSDSSGGSGGSGASGGQGLSQPLISPDMDRGGSSSDPVNNRWGSFMQQQPAPPDQPSTGAASAVVHQDPSGHQPQQLQPQQQQQQRLPITLADFCTRLCHARLHTYPLLSDGSPASTN